MKARGHLHILGLMTGTSCDAVDAACVSLARDGSFRLKWFDSKPIPPKLRKRIHSSQDPAVRFSLESLRALDLELGDFLAKTTLQILQSARRRSKVLPEVLAVHGFTLLHRPSRRLTWQAGALAEIGATTGLTVVGNFREGDVVSGGQGAPLVPGFHQVMARSLPHRDDGIAIHNLGGYSNLTHCSSGNDLIAFDTGPANSWIDAATQLVTRGRQAFDRNGALASQGVIHLPSVERALAHRYFRISPPKSTGRDELSPDYFLKIARAYGVKGPDLVATATACVVESIAQAYERFILKPRKPLSAIYLCGGGSKNPVLWKSLAQRLSPIKVLKLEDFGIDPQTVESMAFAWMGFQSLRGLPVAGPWTRQLRSRPGSSSSPWPVPAVILPGRNWTAVLAKAQA